jgi:hypothetical protein
VGIIVGVSVGVSEGITVAVNVGVIVYVGSGVRVGYLVGGKLVAVGGNVAVIKIVLTVAVAVGVFFAEFPIHKTIIPRR